MKELDALELELRRLDGVTFVGYLPRPDLVVVQVLTADGVDVDPTRAQAERLCRAHLREPFVLEIGGNSRPARVRLLDVRVDEPGEVEVHLGLDGVRTVGRGPAGDPTGAAAATFDALKRLGAKVPFKVVAAALFEHEVGEGVMVVLGSNEAGERYGVAAAASVEQAAARATLHALNRYLSTQTLPALAG